MYVECDATGINFHITLYHKNDITFISHIMLAWYYESLYIYCYN